jgi:hypothetical protein
MSNKNTIEYLAYLLDKAQKSGKEKTIDDEDFIRMLQEFN